MHTEVIQIDGDITTITDILHPEALSKTEAHSTDIPMKVLGQGTLGRDLTNIDIKGIGKTTGNILGLSLTQNLARGTGLSTTSKRRLEGSKLRGT